MARPASPPGADHAAEQAHIPDTLPPPDARPASPPGAEHAADQGLVHIPITLPPEHDDTLVFTSIAETRTLPEQALNAAEHAHLPTELPPVQSHEVPLPEAAGHMSEVAGVHLPDWLL